MLYIFSVAATMSYRRREDNVQEGDSYLDLHRWRWRGVGQQDQHHIGHGTINAPSCHSNVVIVICDI